MEGCVNTHVMHCGSPAVEVRRECYTAKESNDLLGGRRVLGGPDVRVGSKGSVEFCSSGERMEHSVQREQRVEKPRGMKAL